MPPKTTTDDKLVGKQVRSRASSIIGKVVERIDHEPQYRIAWTDENGDHAEVVIEASDAEAV
jgi:hypothetical protein